MPDKAISNTSPLLYLHRCSGLAWLPRLFTLVCVPGAVAFELAEGRSRGFIVWRRAVCGFQRTSGGASWLWPANRKGKAPVRFLP